MEENKNNKKKGKKLRNKYRLIIYNDNTLHEVWQYRLSPLNLISITSSILIMFAVILILVIAFTPLKEFIPGYPDSALRRNILENTIMLDSLERQIELRSNYIANIKQIMEGKAPESKVPSKDTNFKYNNVSFSRSKGDSILRKQVQSQQFNLSLRQKSPSKKSLSQMHFFPPVKGVITNSFDPRKEHFGTDIVAAPNEVVKATLDGTVTMAGWTLETGYIIEIQHKNELISLYKHNTEILKKVGTQVEAGDAIAVIGNSGELTTGPHLHFELWHGGNPVNPENFINF